MAVPNFTVSSSVKLMLLQGQLAETVSAAAAASAPRAPTAAPARAAELAAVLASLNSEGDDCRALLRRCAQSRQCDAGVEEELQLAEDALDMCRSASSSSTSSAWEVSALCAVAEAHLGVQEQHQALEASMEALVLSRARSSNGSGNCSEVEALVSLFKAQMCNCDPRARELLLLWRELGASWGEVAQEVCGSFSLGEDCADADGRAADARETERRWSLSSALCDALVGPSRSLPAAARKTLEDLFDAASACGVLGIGEVDEAEEHLEAGRLSEARRQSAKLLKKQREASTQRCLPGEVAALLVIARAALLLAREDEAFEAAMEALQLSRRVGYRRGEATALQVLAELAGPEAALQLCSEAGRLFCDLEERRAVGSLLSTMSSAHLQLSSSEEALAAARDSLATQREEGRDVPLHVMEEAKALLCFGKAADAASKTAANEAREALTLLGGLLSADLEQGFRDSVLKLQGVVYLVLVDVHLRSSLEEAQEAAEAALKSFRSSTRREAREAAALNALAKVLIAKQEPVAARAAAKEALALLQELKEKEGEKEAMQLLVSAELASNSGSAMHTAKQAVERFQHEGDRKNEALALQTVARTHIANREFLRAARVAKDAQTILAQLGDTEGEIEMLQTAVEAHLAREEAAAKEDALQCAMEAFAEFRRRDNLRGQALVLSLLARTYVQIPDPETAVYVVRDALALFRELGDRKSEHALIRSIINNDLIPSSIEGSDVALKAAKVALAVCHQSEDKRGQAVMLKSTFRILLAREKPERALQAAEEALKMYRELEDQEGEAEMTMEAAKVLLQREEHRRALGAANCAAALYREVGDPRELFALQLAVDVHAARGDHAMVLETSQEVLEKCRSQQDPACEAALLQQICQVYLEQGGKENAEVVARTAKQAHVLAREAGDQHRETCALAALARAHLAASRNQEAVEVAKEAVRCAHESGDRPSQIVALQAFGDVSVKLGHPFDAIEAAKEAMDYARFEGLVVQEAAALGTLVDARLANAEPSEALRAAKEAHDRAKRLGNLRAEAAALSAVAKVCLHIKAPAEAIQALDGAQANYKKLKDRKKEAAVVHLAVKAQLLQGDAVNALRAAKEARGLARELRDRKAEAEALDAASQVHLAKRDFHEALDCAKSMAAIYEELQEDLAAAKAKQLLCSVYLAKGDARAAVDIGEDAVALFRKLQDPQEAVAQHLVAQAYLQRHHDEEKSRQQQGMNRAGTNSQDPAEAVRSALCARALFKERGNITGELEVMDTLARAYIRKGESREGLRVAEDYLAAAKKARDKPAEANALLVSASAMASCQQLNDALRVAELARAIYRDLGNAEGLTDAERFAGVVKEALQEVAQHAAGTSNGYPSGAASRGSGPVGAAGNSNAHGLETRGAPRKLGFSMDAGRRDNGRPDDGSLITGQRRQAGPVDPTPLYNRKAFPWTPQQATPKAPQKAGI